MFDQKIKQLPNDILLRTTGTWTPNNQFNKFLRIRLIWQPNPKKSSTEKTKD